MESNTEQQSAPPMQKTKKSAQGILAWLLCLLLLAGIGGMYYWQHGQVTDLNNQLSLQKQKLSDSESKATSLQKQLTELQKANSLPPTIDVNGAARFSLFSDPNKKYVGVNITIKNNSTSALSLNTKNFVLKNDKNAPYQSYKDVLNGNADNAVIQQTLPKGETLFTDQSLAAGESITSTLVYYVTDNPTSLALSYKGSTYKVVVK